MAKSDSKTTSLKNVMDIFGPKWSFLVLANLKGETKRFNQLSKELNISTKSLTDTLKNLEENEIILREVFPTVPITVEYSLTDKGKDFLSVLTAMEKWETKWIK